MNMTQREVLNTKNYLLHPLENQFRHMEIFSSENEDRKKSLKLENRIG